MRNQKMWDAAVEWAIGVQAAPESQQSGRAFWGLARRKYKDMTARQHNCPKCGGVFESAVARFCPYCRAPIPQPKKQQ